MGIQINQEELTKTFYDGLKMKKPFGLHGLHKKNQPFKVNPRPARTINTRFQANFKPNKTSQKMKKMFGIRFSVR